MIFVQRRIYRSDLKNNPSTLYVFGDNFLRVGKGGQAAECRGEPNAVGIVTKVLPSYTPASYLNDLEETRLKLLKSYQEDFPKLSFADKVVFPEDGIGTGIAEMKVRAPLCWALLCMKLDQLFKHHNYSGPYKLQS